ncbi:MAG: hypothetical protein U5K79_24700 [Cyclobacteriaceae bacterium]|nr:hypothetical protein [Cyclobacteriaceae bacterium]
MKNWLKLIIWMVGIWLFIKSAPILVSMNGEYARFIETAERRGLNVTGLFYSEVPETFAAEKKLQKSREEAARD